MPIPFVIVVNNQIQCVEESPPLPILQKVLKPKLSESSKHPLANNSRLSLRRDYLDYQGSPVERLHFGRFTQILHHPFQKFGGAIAVLVFSPS